MPSRDDVVAIGRRLPEVEESTWFGTPLINSSTPADAAS